jgi:hypothetical protein
MAGREVEVELEANIPVWLKVLAALELPNPSTDRSKY